MFKDEFYISKFIAAHLRGELTPEEQIALNTWLEASPQNRAFFEEFSNEAQFRSDLTVFRAADRNSVWQKSKAKIQLDKANSVPVRTLFSSITRIGVAAAMLIIIGLGVYFYKNSIQSDSGTNIYANDIAPGKQGATLTLANGKQISLAEVGNGELAKQAGVTISKSANGQLVYESKASKSVRPDLNAVNILSTAKGQTYQVRLPDGSEVWLNAASSLTYTANLNKDGLRIVKLDGEGYFEVAKDKVHPFVVETTRQTVTVLGTHFNIDSYANDVFTKTTLVEGSVQVKTGKKNTAGRMLKPGEQSILNGTDITVRPADLEQALAWKKGYFRFNDQSIKSVMEQLSRWYNIEVMYEGKASTESFNGKISRKNNISQVLNALETTKAIHFKVEGRRVTVMQ